MTPHQLNLFIEEMGKMKEIEKKDNIFQAYLISRWVWAKKIDIDKILDFKKEKKAMTDEQMLDQVQVLNKIFGGEEVSN